MNEESKKGATSIAQLLSVNRIIFPSEQTDSRLLLEQLVRRVCEEEPTLDFSSVMAELSKQEGVGPVLETGLALPHCRVDGLTHFTGALAVLPSPLRSPKGGKIRAILLFFSPLQPFFFSQHLRLLAAVAGVFTPDFIRQLQVAGNAQKVLNYFKK